MASIFSDERGLNIAVLCVADHADMGVSRQAGCLLDRVLRAGHALAGLDVFADDDEAIRAHVQLWIDTGKVDVIVILDNSSNSAGGYPPSLVVTPPEGDGPIYTTIIYDAAFGFVGVIDLKPLTQRVA